MTKRPAAALAAVALLAALAGCSSEPSGPSDFDRQVNLQTACQLAAQDATGLTLDIDHGSDTYEDAENGTLEVRMTVTNGGQSGVILCAASGVDEIETTEITRLALDGQLLIG